MVHFKLTDTNFLQTSSHELMSFVKPNWVLQLVNFEVKSPCNKASEKSESSNTHKKRKFHITALIIIIITVLDLWGQENT